MKKYWQSRSQCTTVYELPGPTWEYLAFPWGNIDRAVGTFCISTVRWWADLSKRNVDKVTALPTQTNNNGCPFLCCFVLLIIQFFLEIIRTTLLGRGRPNVGRGQIFDTSIVLGNRKSKRAKELVGGGGREGDNSWKYILNSPTRPLFCQKLVVMGGWC